MSLGDCRLEISTVLRAENLRSYKNKHALPVSPCRQVRGKYFGYQDRLSTKIEARSPRPQLARGRRELKSAKCWRKLQCRERRREERVAPVDTPEFDRAARKTDARKKQRAKRAAAQALQPACHWPALRSGKNRMGKDNRSAVAKKHDFTPVNATVAGDPENSRFVQGRPCEHLP